ncbi:MAG: acyl-CoA thioester hydrolase [Porticoccus sp.]|jgi:acyl-CoA thioester hydrolase
MNMENAFTYLMRVRYADCDAQQVVFNAKYAEYIDVAATEYIRAVWGSFNTLLDQGFDNQVVSLKIDWKASAVFDDVIGIRMATTNIGNSSYTVEAEFFNYETNKVFALATVVYVMVNTADYTKITIPDEFRKTIEVGAPGVLVNHAGVAVK